jgi:beta-N-acetylhexosaminidase
MLSLTACSSQPNQQVEVVSTGSATPKTEVPRPEPTSVVTPTPEPDPIEELIASMTLADKVGQMLMLGFVGTNLSDSDLPDVVRDLKPGGLILLAYNVEGPQSLTQFSQDVQALASEELAAGLLLAIDQEGGTVLRLHEPFSSFPSAATVGAACSIELTRRLGEAVGQEMRAVGLNMDLAPVTDVAGSPPNPAIGTRSFSTRPEVVAILAEAFVAGLHDEGVIATLKHFPGLGAAAADPHDVLPVDGRSESEIESRDILAFEAPLNLSEADAVMTAHVSFPALDPEGRPATLSPEIVTGILRGSLGFDGVVLTDSLTMGGITNVYSVSDAAVAAVVAGADTLMVLGDRANQQAVRDALVDAVAEGAISEDRIDESVTRILKLKEAYEVGNIEPRPEQIGTKDTSELIQEIRQRAGEGRNCTL